MYIPKFNLTCGDRWVFSVKKMISHCGNSVTVWISFYLKALFIHANVTVMRQLFKNHAKGLTFGNHTTAPKRPHHCVQLSVNQSVTLLTFATTFEAAAVERRIWDALTVCGLRRAPQYNTPEILGCPELHEPLVILQLTSSPQPSHHTQSCEQKKTLQHFCKRVGRDAHIYSNINL